MANTGTVLTRKERRKQAKDISPVVNIAFAQTDTPRLFFSVGAHELGHIKHSHNIKNTDVEANAEEMYLAIKNRNNIEQIPRKKRLGLLKYEANAWREGRNLAKRIGVESAVLPDEIKRSLGTYIRALKLNNDSKS